MFSKQIFNRLLQLKYRSVCYKYMIINRQQIQIINKSRCVSHLPEEDRNNQLTINEKINDFVNKSISSKPSRNLLKDIDLNDKQVLNLIGDRKINSLSDKPDNELLDEISPVLGLSFNLAAFADKSETLQNFIKLGVNLSFIENKSPEVAEYLLRLDFETDIKPYIRFLVDNGVKPEELGDYITNNPFIFGQHLDDLKIRINYLESKKFTKQMIASVISKAPKFVNFPTKTIDYRLGLLQKDFGLSADEVRQLITSYSAIALVNDLAFQEMKFVFKEEFGFNPNEIKAMLLKHPILFRKISVFKKEHRIAVKVFDLIHNQMKIPHELIARHPHILSQGFAPVEGRHLYLKKLCRDQYDPKQPLYVPLFAFTDFEDNDFCEKYTKTCVQDFNSFLKSV